MESLKMPFHSGENGEMGRMANLIWETLDDMKLDNPDGYRQFMSRHLKEGFEAMSPPRPAMCIKTKVINHQSPLFINICGWYRVSPPANEGGSLPICPGILQHHNKPQLWSVIDIAIHPSVVVLCQKSKDSEEEIIQLSLKFVQDISGLKLSPEFQREKEKYHGEYHPESVVMALQSPFRVEGKLTLKSKEKEMTVLEKLASIANTETQELCPQPTKDSGVLKRTSVGPLIQEVSRDVRLPQPKYLLQRKEENARHGERLVLKVELPKASGIKDIEVDVMKDGVNLRVPGVYSDLHVSLPEDISEETSSATFSKSRILTVTMPLLK